MRALKHRNYRLFFAGQIVSLCGTWMTSIATGWLVYRLTGSALMLGVVSFAGQIPVLFLGAVAGAIVDRTDKRRALMLTQALSMLQSFALAAAAFSGHASVAVLAALNLFQGAVLAFDIPLRQAFLVEMIEDRADLGNAIALNSSMFNAARLIGPSLGAAVIAAFGEAWCFLIDGFSYAGVIVSFALMRVAPAAPHPRTGVMAGLLEGWRVVARPGPIRRVILLLAVVSLVGAPYMTLMPLFARSILGGDAGTLGILMSSSGAGALLGAVWMAGRRSASGLAKMVPLAAVAFGLGILALSRSSTLWLAAACILASSAALMIQLAASNTMLQTATDDRLRGRVMSFYMMAFLGMAPFGSLLVSFLAQHASPQFAIAAGGLCCLAAACVYLLRSAKAAPAGHEPSDLELVEGSNRASQVRFETKE